MLLGFADEIVQLLDEGFSETCIDAVRALIAGVLLVEFELRDGFRDRRPASCVMSPRSRWPASRAPGPKAVGAAQKALLVHGLQHHGDRSL